MVGKIELTPLNLIKDNRTPKNLLEEGVIPFNVMSGSKDHRRKVAQYITGPNFAQLNFSGNIGFDSLEEKIAVLANRVRGYGSEPLISYTDRMVNATSVIIVVRRHEDETTIECNPRMPRSRKLYELALEDPEAISHAIYYIDDNTVDPSINFSISIAANRGNKQDVSITLPRSSVHDQSISERVVEWANEHLAA